MAGAIKVDALLGQLFLQMVRHDGSFADVVKPLATRGTSSVLTDESTALRLLFETKPIVECVDLSLVAVPPPSPCTAISLRGLDVSVPAAPVLRRGRSGAASMLKCRLRSDLLPLSAALSK